MRLARQPRRSDVERLLEVRPIQRVRFVKNRERGQRPVDQQAFQGDFDARNELFNKQLMCPRIVGIQSSFVKNRGDLGEGDELRPDVDALAGAIVRARQWDVREPSGIRAAELFFALRALLEEPARAYVKSVSR